MDIQSYDYLGYTLVVMPSGKVLIHEGTGTMPPNGKIVGQANNLGGAQSAVNELVNDSAILDSH